MRSWRASLPQRAARAPSSHRRAPTQRLPGETAQAQEQLAAMTSEMGALKSAEQQGTPRGEYVRAGSPRQQVRDLGRAKAASQPKVGGDGGGGGRDDGGTSGAKTGDEGMAMITTMLAP